MLGTEKRIREMYGEGYDDEALKKIPGPNILGFVSFIMAALALVLVVALYFQDTGGRAKRAEAASELAQAQMRSLELRLRNLEAHNGNLQGMLINTMLNEVKQKAAFLAGQDLTAVQKQVLAEALAAFAPPAPAPVPAKAEAPAAAPAKAAAPAEAPAAAPAEAPAAAPAEAPAKAPTPAPAPHSAQ